MDECDVCGLPDPYNGTGDGIGAVRELDEVRASLADYRDALCAMQCERDEARALLAEILPRFLANGHGSLRAIASPGEVAEWRECAGLEG